MKYELYLMNKESVKELFAHAFTHPFIHSLDYATDLKIKKYALIL